MTKEDVRNLFLTLDLDRYDEEELNEWLDNYTKSVNRYYRIPEGEFIVYGQVSAYQFNEEGLEFESKDGEAFRLDYDDIYKAA